MRGTYEANASVFTGAITTVPHQCPSLHHMDVQLTADQKAFIRQAIETGRFRREEDAVLEALTLWEVRERRRAELLTDVDLAESSLAGGERRAITQESMRELAFDVKQRGRARLAADPAPR